MKLIVVEIHPPACADATHVLQSLLATTRVVGVEPDGVLFENLAAHADAELALIDPPSPSIDDLSVLPRLPQQPHPRHVVVLGETNSAAHVCTLVQLNVSVYLLGGYSGKLVVAALKLVFAGGRYVLASVMSTQSEANVVGSPNGDGNDDCALLGLTQRQYETLVLLPRRHPVRIIGRMLSVSETITRAHTNALYRWLGIRGRIEAISVATQRSAMLLNQPSIGAETAPPPARPLRLVRTGRRQLWPIVYTIEDGVRNSDAATHDRPRYQDTGGGKESKSRKA